MSAEIKAATGEEVVLVGGRGGIFEIRRGGKVLYSKASTGRFPESGEAAALFQ